MSTEVEFAFEELCPRSVRTGRLITGMMLYGVAVLSNNGEDDPTNWHVASVTLEGGGEVTYQMARAFPKSLDGKVYEIVESEMGNSTTDLGESAAQAFADALEQDAQDRAEEAADHARDMARGA